MLNSSGRISPQVIMRDPVVAADGHTYDRKEIEDWFKRGNRTSPTTGAALPHGHLTPNFHAKSQIAEFLSK